MRRFDLVGRAPHRPIFPPLSPPGGRLTLTTAVPVTTADVTAATTLYYTPYISNQIALFDGRNWKQFPFAELSIAITATTSTMHDVWAYNSSGVVALEALAWTNDTTRATALALQDGVYCKSGALSRRYLGSYRTTGSSGQTEDSLAKRFVWNMYNRRRRAMKVIEGTDTWTYSTAAWQQANASAANQLAYVCGLLEDAVEVAVNGLGAQSGGGASIPVGIGIDSSTVNSAQVFTGSTTGAGLRASLHAAYKGFPGLGYHELRWLEQSAGATTTFLGDNGGTVLQTGITGMVWG